MKLPQIVGGGEVLLDSDYARALYRLMRTEPASNDRITPRRVVLPREND